MNGQRPGAAPAMPRSGSGQPAPARAGAEHPRVQAGARSVPAQVFDANDDGVVEDWSYMHGGDSFATISPPPTGSDPQPARTGSPNGAGGTHVSSTARTAGRSGTPAAIHHAHDAYRRDGLANAPAPKPAPAPPPVPQPAGRSAVPSTGS